MLNNEGGYVTPKDGIVFFVRSPSGTLVPFVIKIKVGVLGVFNY
jgi:hypothetical protein